MKLEVMLDFKFTIRLLKVTLYREKKIKNGQQTAIIVGIPGCGGVFTTNNGEFGPPLQNGAYQKNLLCEYLIRMPVGSRIQIKFQSFELEESRDCEFDYIEVGVTQHSIHIRFSFFVPIRFSKVPPTKIRK